MKPLILLMGCLFPACLPAQNLIANGDFETRNICTEYEADCAPEAWFKIPPSIIPLDKVKGDPSNSGEFADNVVLENKDRVFSYRVFMYTMLLCPLQKDTVYVLELFVNPVFETHYELGVLFSEEELVPGFVNPLKYTPSLVLTDSGEVAGGEQKNWRKIQVQYKAKGGEQFLTFGNFSKSPLIITKKTKLSNKLGDLLLLIDDVSVKPLSTPDGKLCRESESTRKLIYATNERHSYKKGITRREKSELFEEPSTADPGVPLVPTPVDEPEEEPVFEAPPKAPEKPKEIRFELPDIAFDFDKYTIKPVFYSQLDTFIHQIKAFSPKEIFIAGHTDDRGSEQYNFRISDQRANAVKEYILKGYPEFTGVITAIGMGEGAPKNDNLTPENRAKNRRVEIVVK